MIKDFIEWYKFEMLFPGSTILKAIKNSLKYALENKKWDIINWLYCKGMYKTKHKNIF